jgi:hypothetical protein
LGDPAAIRQRSGGGLRAGEPFPELQRREAAPKRRASRYDVRGVGLFDRLGVSKATRTRKAARGKELAGDLQAAVELYLEASLPDEAARVLLLRADGEPVMHRRVMFCDLAARTAEGEELKKTARLRKARLAFDMLKAAGPARVKSELVAVARDLEEVGELELAADAFALAGDSEGEVRALTAAGAIEKLEERLRDAAVSSREERERSMILSRVTDLDRTGERREALRLADAWLKEHSDEALLHAARSIRARLVRGPMVELEIDGERVRCALGREVVIGRGEATIVVASKAVSRRHVRLLRGPEGPMVEDLGTRNGTSLAGARLSGPIAVGGGLRLELGTGVPLGLAAKGSALVVAIAGEEYVAPLGELELGAWRIDYEVEGDASFVVLRAPPGAPRPVLGSFALGERAELCVGDAIAIERGGPIKLRVPGGAAVERRGSPDPSGRGL